MYRRLPILIVLLAGCAMPCRHGGVEMMVTDDIARALPLADRNRVHVYILDETFRDVSDLRQSLYDAGFAKVSVGGVLWGPYFEAHIRRLHREDPDARFLIVGRGYATAMAARVTQTMQGENVAVEMVPEDGAVDSAVALSQTLTPLPPATVAALPMIDDPAPMPNVAYVRGPAKKPVQGTLTGREGR